MRKLRENLNFSLWCDFLERDFLDNGFLKLLKDETVNGVTSNPAIFKDAILTSTAYKKDLEGLSPLTAKEKYENLAIKDIQISANHLAKLYEDGDDGFVSIEVDPNLCDDAEATIAEAKSLYERIGKKNVMIKIPATSAGYEAISELISCGISVNSTLIFSPSQAQNCVEAYQKGYEKLGDVEVKPKGVISVFVSRFDRKLDEKLTSLGSVAGTLGIMNATKIYHKIEKSGLKEVKTLFASTGVKGDSYPADYYITNLLYKNSVNTAPLNTIDAFVKSENFIWKLPQSEEVIEEFFSKIEKDGIDMEVVYQELIDDGLSSFVDAFDEILESLK